MSASQADAVTPCLTFPSLLPKQAAPGDEPDLMEQDRGQDPAATHFVVEWQMREMT
jgi:hypothetical protein